MNPRAPTLSDPVDAIGERTVLLERAAELARLREAARSVADGRSAEVVVCGAPGTGRSALLAEASAVARQAGLDVVAVACRTADRSRRYGVARDVIAAAAAHGRPEAPLAVIVDDAQWADQRSAHRAGAIARRLAGRPLLLVVAGHDPAVLATSTVSRHVLALRPLSPDGVQTVLAEAYGLFEAAYGDRRCDPLLPAAIAATGGNPAVLSAVVRRCPAPAPTPDELRAVADQVGRDRVRRTLDPLPEHVVALVRACAVGRGNLSFDQVYEAAGVRQPSRYRCRADLARTGLVDDIARPRLRDPLAADRVLALMDFTARRDLYARAARLGRRDGIADPVLGRLVSHTHLTEPWVPQTLYAAGAHARRSGDHAGAVLFLEGALDREATGALRTEVLLELAMAQMYVRPEAADRGLRRVLADTAGSDRAADSDRAAPRLIAADLLTLRGGGRPKDGDGRPSTDPAQAADAAWRHCARGQGIREARSLAAVALAPAALEIGLFAPGLTAVRVLAIAEDVEVADGELDRIEAEARRRGVRPAVGLAMLTRADLALRRGDLTRARNQLVEAVTEIPRRHWHPRVWPRLTALTALVDLESGLIDSAQSTLAGAVPDGHEHGLGWIELLFARSLLELRTGQTADAAAHLRECGRNLLSADHLNPAVLPWRSHLAMAQASTQPDTAALLLEQDLAAARDWGAPGTIGAVHLWTGLALSGPVAVGHLRSAVRVLAGSAARSRYVQAMVELAAVLLDGGQAASGSGMLSEAMKAMRTDGGRPTPRAEEVAARYAESTRAARARLSPTQLRIALLAAEGESNKTIADALSITRRAVEMHLTNGYRVLGIGGRAELGATLGHSGPDPGDRPGDGR